MSFAHKRMGTIGVSPVKKPSGAYADAAKQRQKQRQERIITRRENFVLLNKHRYPNLYEKWLKTHPTGHGKLPNCPVCRDAVIHWNEPAHECPGYKPMYEDADKIRERWEARADERRERWEQQREHIREAKANGQFYDEGNEDEPEYDYCEGDDDGWECEDDGDPMYD